jgi:hypothetical protein
VDIFLLVDGLCDTSGLGGRLVFLFRHTGMPCECNRVEGREKRTAWKNYFPHHGMIQLLREGSLTRR